MAILDDIQAQIDAQRNNPWVNTEGAGVSDAVRSIDNQYSGSLIDQLTALKNSVASQLTGYQNQLNALPSQYQPIYDTLNTNKANATNAYNTDVGTLNTNKANITNAYNSDRATLAQNKTDTTNKYNTNIANAKVENQDVLNQNAVDLEGRLRSLREQMANYGSLGSGQYPILQLQATVAQQNADNKVYSQRTQDVNNFTQALASALQDIANQQTARKSKYDTDIQSIADQLTSRTNSYNTTLQDIANQYAQQQAKQAADQKAVQDAINALYGTGENEMQSYLSSSAAQRLGAIQQQQAAEAQAQAEAQAAAQKLAEQQYEAQLAAQARIQAAAIAHSGSGSSGGRSSGGSSGGGSGMSSNDVANVQRMLNSVGYNLAVDGVSGPATRRAIEDFQSRNGLAVDGIVGPQTLKALQGVMDAYSRSTNTPSPETIITNGGVGGYARRYTSF